MYCWPGTDGNGEVAGKERATLARSSNLSQLSDEAADGNIQYEVEDGGMLADILPS